MLKYCLEMTLKQCFQVAEMTRSERVPDGRSTENAILPNLVLVLRTM